MKKVLIVDDSEIIRHGIAKLLDPFDVQVIHAINGIDGVRKALRYCPDLITMDVEMPHLSGIHTTRILAMLQLEIPVVFITSKDNIQEYVEQYPNVYGYCLKQDLRQAFPIIIEKMIREKSRGYTDLTYPLTQKEVLDLLSLSNRKKILVLEDSHMMMSVMLKHLDHTKLYELYHAPNGLEGIFKSVIIQPDLILSDIEMPEIDGITMAQTLYIIGRPFPIGFASAKSDTETLKKVMKLKGVRGFLIKQEVLKDESLFQQRIEEMMQITPEEKQALQQDYENIDINKLRDSGETKGVFQVRYNPAKKAQLRKNRG
ncbi:MAG: response regulator [SAR324 cluster bacterium]|nr:response regulator [SAR324 cluster bacterium]